MTFLERRTISFRQESTAFDYPYFEVANNHEFLSFIKQLRHPFGNSCTSTPNPWFLGLARGQLLPLPPSPPSKGQRAHLYGSGRVEPRSRSPSWPAFEPARSTQQLYYTVLSNEWIGRGCVISPNSCCSLLSQLPVQSASMSEG